jgi:hypothetical protein
LLAAIAGVPGVLGFLAIAFVPAVAGFPVLGIRVDPGFPILTGGSLHTVCTVRQIKTIGLSDIGLTKTNGCPALHLSSLYQHCT